jgi:predicted Zn finger-like uncharacterized protein
MDVQCERCKTEYELDETRISDAGLTVKCTQCGNIFKVRKPFVSTPALETSAPQKEWRVRRQDGQQLALRNLTELQRWIVERRVGPNDEVSLSGETWRKLGTLPELGAFFEVVQVAEQGGRGVGAPPVSRDVALSDTMVGIPMDDPGERNPRSRTPAWTGQPIGGQAAPEPAWVGSGPSVDVDLDDQLSAADLKRLRGGGAGRFIVLLIILAAVGVAAYVLVKLQPGSPPGTLPAPKQPSLEEAQQEPATAPAPAAQAEPSPQAAAPAAEIAKPTPPAEAKAEPKTAVAAAPAPTAAPAPAPAKEAVIEPGGVPNGKGINFYLTQGHHLLDSKPELALRYFAKAGEMDPRSPEPDSGRGLAFSNMERWNDAVNAFQVSLKKSPEYTEALMGLAEAYRAQGTAANKRKALVLYKRYLDLAPDGPDAPVAKAQVEILEGDLKADSAPAANTAESPRSEAPSKAAPVDPEPAAAPPAKESAPEPPPPPVLAPDTPPKPTAP